MIEHQRVCVEIDIVSFGYIYRSHFAQVYLVVFEITERLKNNIAFEEYIRIEDGGGFRIRNGTDRILRRVVVL